MDQPVHDIHSECADAFRQFGQLTASGDLGYEHKWVDTSKYQPVGIV